MDSLPTELQGKASFKKIYPKRMFDKVLQTRGSDKRRNPEHDKNKCRDLATGGLVAKTLSSQSREPGSIPGQGTRSHMP